MPVFLQTSAFRFPVLVLKDLLILHGLPAGSSFPEPPFPLPAGWHGRDRRFFALPEQPVESPKPSYGWDFLALGGRKKQDASPL